jgi:undecaprenyl diphosphate synthase
MSSDPAIVQQPGQVPSLRIPGHIGVIMDGNGRWAQARGQPRTDGHAEGVKALRRLVELCIRYGIDYLTVFSFSSENWSRPKEEISFIFSLLRRFVASDLERLIQNNVQVRVIGAREGLDSSLVRLIEDVEAKTRDNTGLKLMVAFNYGGKAEIAAAVRRLAKRAAQGTLRPDAIDEAAIEAELYTAGVPDPDIVIRTSGERRFSNFLLWQSAYSELAFVDCNWPDFDEAAFLSVLEDYSARDRRFGGIEARR